MSAVEVVPVPLKRGPLKKFVKFGISLYKGNDCYVPPLIFDEVETFLPSRNPAFAFARRNLSWLFVTVSPLVALWL